MGPLALMASNAGLKVSGSDLAEGAVSRELVAARIPFKTGAKAQDGAFLKERFDAGEVDWFVYTSALPPDHPELVLAQELGLRVSKRDELIAFLVDMLGLSLVAVAGTHGKTTTTSMIIWACLELGVPISYLVGTTLPFAASGAYDPSSQFLVYEADEYDRNFLHFSPWLAVIPSISYDHPDIYPTREDYQLAFRKFIGQSEYGVKPSERDIAEALHAGKNDETPFFSGCTTLLSSASIPSDDFTLAGIVRRIDASLAAEAVLKMSEKAGIEIPREEVVEILNHFPGSGRRFERICPGVYSDYGHHPEEIAATIDLAREEASRLGLKGVVAVYEPHQNTRQHEVFDDYKHAFDGVSRLYWLPTYLTRENPELDVISPEDFIASLAPEVSEVAEPAKPTSAFGLELQRLRGEGYLILLLTAGPADKWLRETFASFSDEDAVGAEDASEERGDEVDVEGVRETGEEE